jgi:glutathione S-transferase
VIVQWLADLRPEAGLIPAAGSLDRIRVQEWLSFVAAELHRSYTPLFDRDLAPACREKALAKLAGKLDFVEAHLAGRDYLMGERFTVADAYCFTIVNWAGYVGVEMAPWPALRAYHARVRARPAVQRAMSDEGLV